MKRHSITIDSEAIRGLCDRYGIAELFVFGSLVRDDFRQDSDVDFVIHMEDGLRMTFRKLGELERELSSLVGRPVDIVLETEMNAPGANPYRKRSITETMESIYARR